MKFSGNLSSRLNCRPINISHIMQDNQAQSKTISYSWMYSVFYGICNVEAIKLSSWPEVVTAQQSIEFP